MIWYLFPCPTLLPISPPPSQACAPSLLSPFQFHKLSIFSVPLTFAPAVLLLGTLTPTFHPLHTPTIWLCSLLPRSLPWPKSQTDDPLRAPMHPRTTTWHHFTFCTVMIYLFASPTVEWDPWEGSCSLGCVHWLPSTWHRTWHTVGGCSVCTGFCWMNEQMNKWNA